ncbi:DUF4132 domain-containing protein [Aneurinibacillus aneurinilyticus]|uniref:DUF4132 domain-containing protein n=1 Tax=Aneurinibacillus aneurinilyticus TaxID=1391 RepID=UPI002E1DA080|nr:DUF4132 domain-containing protein [Aneurinibacillus aneurinilyticus]
MLFKSKQAPLITAFATVCKRECKIDAEQYEQIIDYVAGECETLPELSSQRIYMYDFESTIKKMWKQGMEAEYFRALQVLYRMSATQSRKMEVISLYIGESLIFNKLHGEEDVPAKLYERAEKLKTIRDVLGEEAIRIYAEHFIKEAKAELARSAGAPRSAGLTVDMVNLLLECKVISLLHSSYLEMIKADIHPFIYYLVTENHAEVSEEVDRMTEELCTSPLPAGASITYLELEKAFREKRKGQVGKETLPAKEYKLYITLLCTGLLYKVNLHGSKENFLHQADASDQKLLDALAVLYDVIPLDLIDTLLLSDIPQGEQIAYMEDVLTDILPATEPYLLLLSLLAIFRKDEIAWDTAEQSIIENPEKAERVLCIIANSMIKGYIYKTLQEQGVDMSHYASDLDAFFVPAMFTKSKRVRTFYRYITGGSSLEEALEQKVLNSRHLHDAVLLLSFFEVRHEFCRRLFILFSHYEETEYNYVKLLSHFCDSFGDKVTLLMEAYMNDPEVNAEQFLFNIFDFRSSYWNKFTNDDYKKIIMSNKESILCIYGKLPVEERILVLETLFEQKKQLEPSFLYQVLQLGLHDTSKKASAIAVAEFIETRDKELYIHLYKTEKKAKVKELALDALRNIDGYKDVYRELLANEKNKKFTELLQQFIEAEDVSLANAHANVAKMIDKRKLARLKWLAIQQLPDLVEQSGQPFSQDMKEYILSHSVDFATEPSPKALEMKEYATPQSLGEFAIGILQAWMDNGSPAKEKWVLPLCAIFGDYRITDILAKQIKEWTEQGRGAIASEAVKALAFMSDTTALRMIDQLKHTVKNRQVKKAAADALLMAAQHLNITPEELEDRLVPNLGFDETGTRTFNYGQRTFTVKVNNELEIVVTNDENGKILKNLPKPTQTDDAELAEQAREEMKLLKKELKNAIKIQSMRLENALSTNRLWSTNDWKNLFVNNVLMQRFAIGLIWGVYEEDRLQETFRYMEDGTFNTSDEEEYEWQEDVRIGLVHPLELTPEVLEAWRTQLEDYEIAQPIIQLERPLFFPTKEECEMKAVARFTEHEYAPGTFANRMEKLGWYKGVPQDAGFYTEFYKEYGNIIVELLFSGTSISYYEGMEDIHLEELAFYRNHFERYHYYRKESRLDIATIPPRIFSETLYDITRATEK